MSRLNQLAALLLFASLFEPAPAEAAFCTGDNWGGNAAGIDSSGPLTAKITATTTLIHFGPSNVHQFCSGDFYAKATLVSGFGPSCESNTATTHHNFLGEGSTAQVQKICSGLNYDQFYYGGGIHWGFGESEDFSQSSSSVSFPSAPPCDCDSDPECCVNVCQGTWDPAMMECNRASPILINLGSNSKEDLLTSAEDGVWFDIKARGTPRRVAWTRTASRVGFLALDRNGNGAIDDGSELFGTATPTGTGACARNGFLALAELDGNNDGRIDKDDPIYSSLRLWIDTNHNGSESEELMTSQDAGITTLFTEYGEDKRLDRHGNWYRYEGTALVRTKGGVEIARRVYDVFLIIAFQ